MPRERKQIVKSKWIIVFLLIITVAIFCSCKGKNQPEQSTTFKIYYVNYDETAVFSNEYVTQTIGQQELVEELLEQLGMVPEKLEYKAPLSGNFKIVSHTVVDDRLILDFDEGYRTQSVTTEVLVRAAIVRTLTQVEGISYVAFQVNSQPITDASGIVVGIMNAEQFIDNAGNEISTYEKAKLTLYFSNEEGNGLKQTARTVVYNSNIPIERLVVEQLIAGPNEGETVYPTVNPGTKIVSVNVKDGICYVNLNNTFLTQVYNVSSDVTLYSITNSLVELANVNKVQISINGDTNVNYRENVSLATVFERNLELIE